jgi:hypothetical protein
MNASELSWFINQIFALENKLQNDQRNIQHQLIEKDRIIESLKTIEAPLCENCKTSKSTKSIQTEDLLITMARTSTSDDDDFEDHNNFVSSIQKSKRFSRNSYRKFTKFRNMSTYSKKQKSCPTLSSSIPNDYNAMVFHNNKQSTEFPKNDDDCWYASDSASDSAGVYQKQQNIYEAGNPVLECVNQVSINFWGKSHDGLLSFLRFGVTVIDICEILKEAFENLLFLNFKSPLWHTAK